jgi:hypothetical protein
MPRPKLPEWSFAVEQLVELARSWSSPVRRAYGAQSPSHARAMPGWLW